MFIFTAMKKMDNNNKKMLSWQDNLDKDRIITIMGIQIIAIMIRLKNNRVNDYSEIAIKKRLKIRSWFLLLKNKK